MMCRGAPASLLRAFSLRMHRLWDGALLNVFVAVLFVLFVDVRVVRATLRCSSFPHVCDYLLTMPLGFA